MTRETATLSIDHTRFAVEDTGTFTGYAAVFGEPNAYGEILKPGAFKRSLAQRGQRGPVMFFWNHDPGTPIGTWSSISEDARGLKVAGKIVLETRAGSEAYALLKAGAVTGLSIGFNARKQERGPNGERVLTDVELVEISLVTLPAAAKARVTNVRSADMSGVAAFTKAARRTAMALKWSAP